MAGSTANSMLGVTEENEVRQHINWFFGLYLRIFRQIESGVADLAFLGFREGCALGGFGGHVAGDALHFQRRVERMAESDRLGAKS